MTSIAVGVVVVALLLAWLNYEITSTLNGDKAAAEFERAQDRFGDRTGVLDMYHDEFGNTTMKLAPVATVTEEYEDLAQDAASYFEDRDHGTVTLRIDQTELTLRDDDDDARRLGLRLVDQLRSLDGLQEILISASAHNPTVEVDDGLNRSVVSVYRDVQEACAGVARDEDVGVSVSAWGMPRGHISDELGYDYDAEEDQDRSADLSREFAIYQRYARTYEVVEVFIEPADVRLTINENVADARSDARRDHGSSGIEITIDAAEAR
ncbi:hypothetical protein [Promicromonospora sp. AC04]|uniref:hypothetical protein n=1 Tax=Promicromonospora sp. AC04 TaxID=2135723 RepID=UPI000D38239E|nr:hypothetical protein [Promicromonospora sp. AC04]